MVTDDDLALARVYPPLEKIQDVSFIIAVKVAEYAYDHKIATRVCIHEMNRRGCYLYFL